MNDRNRLLSEAFRSHPTSIGPIQVRPVTPGSYQLLADLGNPMAAALGSGGGDSSSNFFAAVVQFAWVHSAPLEKVMEVHRPEDIPEAGLRAIAFQVTMEDVLIFLTAYKEASLRAAAAMAEAMDDDEGGEGKPVPLAIPHSGSPASSSPSVPPETPPAKDMSSGNSHLHGLSSISTPPVPPMETAADGSGSFPEEDLPPLIFLTDLSGCGPNGTMD